MTQKKRDHARIAELNSELEKVYRDSGLYIDAERCAREARHHRNREEERLHAEKTGEPE